jgi:hypothetical protein
MKTKKGLKAAALISSLVIWIAYSFLPSRSSAGNALPPTSEINALLDNLSQARQRVVHPSAAVHGTVVVQTRPTTTAKQRPDYILMPGIEVYLHNMTTNEDSPPERSDMMGRFEFQPMQNGKYELRWRAQKGWAAGTFPTAVSLTGHVFYADPVVLRPQEGRGVITGSIHLADGTTPWFYSEEHHIVKAATVSALDASTNKALAEPVIANFAGQFAIAGIDRTSTPKLVAASEGSRMEKTLPAGLFSSGTITAPVTITFTNHRPRILDISALVNGQRVRSAAPGSTVQVKANIEDADGDTLEIKWTTDSGTVTGNTATVEWKLPDQPGIYSLTVFVTDRMGGAITKQFSIEVGRQSNTFRGMVVDPKGAPIAGADVSVNGTATKSRSDGSFEVSPEIGKQYVLNIYKQGFALLSRLLDRPVTQRWQLVRAQVEKVQATKEIILVDSRPEIRRKKLGGSLQLGPGLLVDPAGKKASGTLTVELATLDIANDEMPGDFLAADGVSEVGITSYGALWVQFTNAAGQNLQLAPGATATVTIPVQASMRAGAPKKMPVWSYDEKDGRWKPSGKAKYKVGQQAYVGTVNHLSTINMDQPGPVSCIRVHTDIGLPAGLRLRVSDAPGGIAFAQVKSMLLAGELNKADGPLNAVFRVPANNDVKFEILNDSGVLVSGSPNPMVVVEDGDTRLTIGTPLVDNIVTTGPANADLWPDYDFASCKDVTLKLFPRWGSYPVSSFLFKKAPLPGDPGTPATEATALAYYAAVDPPDVPAGFPQGRRTTLGAWWLQNGFDPANGNPAPAMGEPLTNYARTSYLNNNDLGSGRDMHFHRSPDGTLSAFVTNYSRNVSFDQRAEFADDALDGIASAASNPGATVCMEFKPVETDLTNRKIVKFFVFAGNGNTAAAIRQTKADLDGFGARFVPGLCVNCHGYDSGGGYFNPLSPTLDDVDIGSSFRELDLSTYHFPGSRLAPNAAEQAATRLQNLMIRDTALAFPFLSPQNPVARGPIVALINGWYSMGADQDNTFTPAAWELPGSGSMLSEGLYQDVVKVSCRTCHIAFDSSDDSTGLDWNRYDQMSLTGFRNDFIRLLAVGPNWTTGSARIMPHALVTYRNFWLQTTVHPNPQGSRAQRLWEYVDGANWAAFGPPVLP